MHIKTIPLSTLENALEETLNECAESGQTVVIEMPDHRLLSLHSLEADADDDLINELLATDPNFVALVERSKASPRKHFLA